MMANTAPLDDEVVQPVSGGRSEIRSAAPGGGALQCPNCHGYQIISTSTGHKCLECGTEF